MPYIHRQCVCVSLCVYVSQSKRENHPPVPQEGGWEIEWPYIHKDMACVCVCVWQKGKPSCSTGGGAGSPSSLASWKSTKPQGWGEGMPQEAEHKTAAVGEGDAAEAEGYPVPQRGDGAGRIHHDVHCLLKYGRGGRGGGEGRAGRGAAGHIFALAHGIARPRPEPTQTRGREDDENDPSQCFFTGAENRIRAGTGAPFARGEKSNIIFCKFCMVTST